MKRKSNPQPALFWLLLATLFLTACGGKKSASGEAAIQRALNAANELLYDGEVELALRRLEALEMDNPGNPAIVEALAFAYAKQPDPGMAAIYFDQAFSLDPENTDLALYAARAHQESNNFRAAANSYRAYLLANPGDPVALKALARAEAQLNRNQAALDAFLEAFRRSSQQPTPEEAALVGHLFHALDNPAQAERYYRTALTPDAEPADRLTAQLGLFDLALQKRDWPQAYERMQTIESEFPGELTQGPYASSRRELVRWKQAQDKLANASVTGNASPVTADDASEGGETDQSEETLAEPEVTASSSLGNLTEDTDPAAAKGGPVRVDLTADLAQPATASDGETVTAEAIGVIGEAETIPVASIEDAPAMTITTDRTISEMTPPAPRRDAAAPPTPSPAPTSPPRPTPQSAAQRGNIAYEAEDYVTAIRFYGQALAENPGDADLAYRLSRAYYNQGQYREAELFASEAVRMDRNDVRYTLNHLRAIQRTMSQEALMRELIRAKERFPESPDITLALGRAYEVLVGNTRNARFLYEEFLAMAPQHPRAEDIRAKLRTLPR